MIIKSGLWLLSFVTALRIANTQLLISAGESIAANLVGHCPVLVYNDSKLSSLNELLQTDLDHINNHDLRVFAMSMNELEVQQYARLPKTLTWLNEKLALGIVDGQPKAQAWVDRKDTSWTITPDHPRSNKSQCMQLTKQAVAKPAALYDSSALQSQLVQPYLLHAKQAIIHDSGILALQCGYFQSHESCETKYKFIGRKWYKQCLSQIQTSKVIWQDIFGNSSNVHQNLCVPKRPTLRPTRKPTGKEGLLVNPNLQHEEKVFVITSNWDHNYHHFLFDSITRMVKYLPFLHSNPDIKIHSRRTEQFGHNVHNMYENSVALRKKILLLLGLDPSRLIFGTVAAKQVYYPRSMICNFPTTNALEIRKLANYLLEKAREVTAAKALVNGRSPFVVHQAATRNKELSEPKKIIVQQRYCAVAANCTNTWRSWTAEKHEEIVQELMKVFPSSEIVSISDYNSSRADCLACEIVEYSTADILIGHHGAGLTNAIFMKPQSMLVETTGQFDGRMFPVCGYHGPIAAMMGLHHLIHYFDWKGKENVSMAEIAPKMKRFYRIAREQ